VSIFYECAGWRVCVQHRVTWACAYGRGSESLHVSPSWEALLLRAPLGVSIPFENAVDGLLRDPQACAQWRVI
jgi:hypothetical protein